MKNHQNRLQLTLQRKVLPAVLRTYVALAIATPPAAIALRDPIDACEARAGAVISYNITYEWKQPGPVFVVAYRNVCAKERPQR